MEVVQPKDSLHFPPRLGKESGGYISRKFRLVWRFTDISKISGALILAEDLIFHIFFFLKHQPGISEKCNQCRKILYTNPNQKAKWSRERAEFLTFPLSLPPNKNNGDGESRK